MNTNTLAAYALISAQIELAGGSDDTWTLGTDARAGAFKWAHARRKLAARKPRKRAPKCRDCGDVSVLVDHQNDDGTWLCLTCVDTIQAGNRNAFVAIGDDGVRPVVWGIGDTEYAAAADARDQLAQTVPGTVNTSAAFDSNGDEILAIVEVAGRTAEAVLLGTVGVLGLGLRWDRRLRRWFDPRLTGAK